MLHEEECRRQYAAPPPPPVHHRRSVHTSVLSHSIANTASMSAFQCLLIAAKMRWQSKVGTTAGMPLGCVDGCQFQPHYICTAHHGGAVLCFGKLAVLVALCLLILLLVEVLQS